MDRRSFLSAVAAGPLAAALKPGNAAASSSYAGVSVQTFVWSQVYQKQGKDVKDHLGEVFGEIASAGYDGVETMTTYTETPKDANQLKDLLKQHRLTLTGLYRGGILHVEDQAKKTVKEIEASARAAADLGCHHLIVNPATTHDHEKTEDELRCQAKYLNEAGALTKALSVSLDLHFHAPEMKNNAREFRWNMDETDPELIHLCADVHWMYRGGADTYGLLEKYGSRLRGTHLRNSVNGIWSEDLSEGDLDYTRIARLLQDAEYPGYLTVELAYEKETPETRSLAENIKRSREFIRQVFGA
ncbi:MAG: sugar phosphate isomerase/epimerase [bacterium]